MPIEFRCTRCERLLRTPDGSAGQFAVCPECGATAPIPELLPNGAAGPAWQSAPGTASLGSGSAWESGVSRPLPDAPGRPALDLGVVFSRTWNAFVPQWPTAILGPLLALVVWLTGLVGSALLGAAVALGVYLLVDNRPEVFISLAVAAGVAAWLAISAWLHAGVSLMVLKVARGVRAEVADVFAGGPYVVRILVAQVLILVSVLFGLCLCIFPGVIFWLMFSQSTMLIVDRNVGAVESLGLSCRVTRGNKLALLAIVLIAWLASTTVSSMTAALATVLVAPLLRVMYAVIYLILTGRATASATTA